MTTSEIIELAHKFARARAKLISRCGIIQRAINRLKYNNRNELAINAAATAAAYKALEAAIEENKHLFEKPQTLVIDGIKFGLRKKKGTLDWDDDAKLIERIREIFSENKAESLIRTTRAPDAAAIEKLTGEELKKLGVTISNDTKAPTIIATCDTEVEKLAAAFLKDEQPKEP